MRKKVREARIARGEDPRGPPKNADQSGGQERPRKKKKKRSKKSAQNDAEAGAENNNNNNTTSDSQQVSAPNTETVPEPVTVSA